MLISCKKCKNVYSVEDDYKKRYKDGDIKFQCKLCGVERCEIVV